MIVQYYHAFKSKLPTLLGKTNCVVSFRAHASAYRSPESSPRAHFPPDSRSVNTRTATVLAKVFVILLNILEERCLHVLGGGVDNNNRKFGQAARKFNIFNKYFYKFSFIF